MTDREVMQQALEALKTWERMTPETTACAIRVPTIAALREALAQPETTATYTCGVCGVSMQMEQLTPRQPLTDEEIKLVMDGRGEEGDNDYVKPAFDPFGISEDDLMNFARAIEAAHGIKEKT